MDALSCSWTAGPLRTRRYWRTRFALAPGLSAAPFAQGDLLRSVSLPMAQGDDEDLEIGLKYRELDTNNLSAYTDFTIASRFFLLKGYIQFMRSILAALLLLYGPATFAAFGQTSNVGTISVTV